MASPILIPCLVTLRSEFNTRYPSRKLGADGWIGDAAHQQETSDHNDDEVGNVPIHDADSIHEVHAVDVDNRLDGTLRIDQPGDPMEKAVQFLLGRCRSGAEKRLRYIIYNRRIWKASNGWKQEAYTGASAHREHAHFSASYETALEASTASWGIATFEGDEDTVLQSDIDKIIAGVNASASDDNGTIQYGMRKALAAYIDDFGNWTGWVAFRAQVANSFAAQDGKLAQLIAAAGLEATEVPPTPEAIADAVFLKLGSGGESPATVATALVAAVGRDKARAIATAINAV